MIGVRGTYWGIYAHLASEESASVVCQAQINGSSTIKDAAVRVNIRSDPKGTCNGTRSGSPGGRARGRNCRPSVRAMQDATSGRLYRIRKVLLRR